MTVVERLPEPGNDSINGKTDAKAQRQQEPEKFIARLNPTIDVETRPAVSELVRPSYDFRKQLDGTASPAEALITAIS